MKFTSNHTPVEGNITSEHVKSTFDEKGAIHLMALLSNIYGDSKEAVIREYAANGLDSHVIAGSDQPVEVILPTILSPTVKFIDHGCGMSLADLIDVYAKYGASTKRDNNAEIGGFGIGAKSAYTVSSAFTVEAVKDGERTVAVFSIVDDMPGYQILVSAPTDKPNGVTVQVPAQPDEIEEWEAAARRVFLTWPEGSVLVNGSVPETIFANSKKIGTSTWVIQDKDHYSYEGGARVVVGGVAYRLNYALASKIASVAPEAGDLVRSAAVIFEVPMGEVQIAPNRESLRDTPQTVETIARVALGAVEAVREEYNAALEAEDTIQGKYVVAYRWRDEFKKVAPISMPFPEDAKPLDVLAPNVSGGGRWGSRPAWSRDFPVGGGAPTEFECVFVVNLTDDNDGKVRRLIPRWRRENDNKTVVLVYGPSLTREWWSLDAEMGHSIMDVEDFITEAKTYAPMSSTTSTSCNIPTYTLYRDASTIHTYGGAEEIPATDVKDLDKPVLVGDGSSWRLRQMMETGIDLSDYYIIVLTGRQSQDVLVRRLGDNYAGMVYGVARAKVQEMFDALTTEQRENYRLYLGGAYLSKTVPDEAMKIPMIADLVNSVRALDDDEMSRIASIYTALDKPAPEYEVDERVQWFIRNVRYMPDSVIETFTKGMN